MNIYSTPKSSKKQYDFKPIYYVYMYLREKESGQGPKGSLFFNMRHGKLKKKWHISGWIIVEKSDISILPVTTVIHI